MLRILKHQVKGMRPDNKFSNAYSLSNPAPGIVQGPPKFEYRVTRRVHASGMISIWIKVSVDILIVIQFWLGELSFI